MDLEIRRHILIAEELEQWLDIRKPILPFNVTPILHNLSQKKYYNKQLQIIYKHCFRNCIHSGEFFMYNMNPYKCTGTRIVENLSKQQANG